MITLGQCHKEIEQYDEARMCLEEAAKLIEKVKDQDKREQAKQQIYHTLGQIYFYGFNDRAKALEAYQWAKENCRNNNNLMAKLDILIKDLEHSLQNQEVPMDIDSKINPRRFKEAQDVAEMLTRMERMVTEGSKWHIISMDWVSKWQKYAYFDQLPGQEGVHVSEEERIHPGKIDNSDIILVPPSGSFLPDSSNLTVWQNLQMKPNLKENEDYLIIDHDIWQYVSEKYGFNQDILRFGVKTSEESEECIVEIYLKQILVHPIPNGKLFNFNGPKSITISRRETIEDLAKKIQKAFNFYLY